MVATKFGSISMWFYYIAAAAFTAFICWSVWPGLMSFDPLHVLYQARFGLVDNVQPSVCTYLQLVFDWIYPGPGLLFIFQVGSYVFGCATIVYLLNCRRVVGFATLLLLVFFPPMLGLLMVVWKDTGSMAFLTAAFAAIMYAEKRKSYGALAAGIMFALLGVSFRLNAIAAAPAFFALIFIGYDKIRVERAGGVKPLPDASGSEGVTLLPYRGGSASSVAIRATLASFVVLCGVMFLNAYRLPDMKRLEGHLGTVMQLFDLIGIAHYSGDMVVPAQLYAHYNTFSVQELAYYPDNVEYSFETVPEQSLQKPMLHDALNALQNSGKWQNAANQTLDYAEVDQRWRSAVSAHPGAFLQHKLAVAGAFLGLNTKPLHDPIHPGVDKNDLGVQFIGSPVYMPLLYLVLLGANLPFAHPWFLYCTDIALLVVALRKRPEDWQRVVLLLASGLAMCAVLLPVTLAADFRYHSWGLASTMIALVVMIVRLKRTKGLTKETETPQMVS